MSTNKRLTDLTDYTSVLPYDSEMFGVYQPLIGWKSRRIEKRFASGFSNDKKALLDVLKEKFSGQVKIKYGEGCLFEIQDIQPGSLVTGNLKSPGSVVIASVAEKLPPFSQANSMDVTYCRRIRLILYLKKPLFLIIPRSISKPAREVLHLCNSIIVTFTQIHLSMHLKDS